MEACGCQLKPVDRFSDQLLQQRFWTELKAARCNSSRLKAGMKWRNRPGTTDPVHVAQRCSAGGSQTSWDQV